MINDFDFEAGIIAKKILKECDKYIKGNMENTEIIDKMANLAACDTLIDIQLILENDELSDTGKVRKIRNALSLYYR